MNDRVCHTKPCHEDSDGRCLKCDNQPALGCGPTLGETVSARRAVLGLSLSQVALGSGLTKSHISDIENGKTLNPTCETLVGLSSVLKMKAADLFEVAARLA